MRLIIIPEKSHSCYLLQSIKGKYYVGYSNDPYRRLRQHNGELIGGALKTQTGRPWILICVVVGFPNKNIALRFEWWWGRWKDPLIGLKRVIEKGDGPWTWPDLHIRWHYNGYNIDGFTQSYLSY